MKKIIITAFVLMIFGGTIWFSASFYIQIRKVQIDKYDNLQRNFISQQELITKTLKAYEKEALKILNITNKNKLKTYVSRDPDKINASTSDDIVSIIALDPQQKFLYGWEVDMDGYVYEVKSYNPVPIIKNRYWLSIELNALFHTSRAVYLIQKEDLSYLVITFSLDSVLGAVESLNYGFQSHVYVDQIKENQVIPPFEFSLPGPFTRLKNDTILLESPISDHWVLVFTGIWDDLYPASPSDIHSIFYVIILWGISSTLITAILLRAGISRPKSLWATSCVFDAFCLLLIIFFFLGFPDTSEKINARTATFRNLQKFWYEHDKEITYIPTTMYIESLSFPDDISYFVTGFISQVYPSNVSIEKGFVFPNQSTIFPPVVTEVFRQDNGETITILWQFGVQLTQTFLPDFFPFDKRTLNIIIWPKEITKNIVLFPDFQNFNTLEISKWPGVNSRVDVIGWNIVDSNYLLEDVAAYHFFEKTNIPVTFKFVIDLKRDFLGAFLSNALALILCIIVAFLVLFIPPISLLDSLLATISIFVGLIFIAVTNHAALRSSLHAASFAYCEYFFISFYILVLAITIDFILRIGRPSGSGDKQFLLAISYWPILLGSFTAILAIVSL